MPLKSYVDFSAFKLYMIDVGLLCAMSELDIESVISGNKNRSNLSVFVYCLTFVNLFIYVTIHRTPYIQDINYLLMQNKITKLDNTCQIIYF